MTGRHEMPIASTALDCVRLALTFFQRSRCSEARAGMRASCSRPTESEFASVNPNVLGLPLSISKDFHSSSSYISVEHRERRRCMAALLHTDCRSSIDPQPRLFQHQKWWSLIISLNEGLSVDMSGSFRTPFLGYGAIELRKSVSEGCLLSASYGTPV